jgi:zeaxanthin glucosyltransferase
MSHFAILCPPSPGHLNPMATLGRALKARGHRVTALHLPELRQCMEKEGLEFIPLGDDIIKTGEFSEALDRLSRLTGLQALRFTIQCAVKLARLVLRDAPQLLCTAGFDMALVDQNEPAGASAAQRASIPFINVAHLPLNRESAMPPPFVPWPYQDTLPSRIRNWAGYWVADLLIQPLTSVLNDQRRKWKLPILRSPNDSFSELAQITTLPKAFDFPRHHAPACFHYVGPFIDQSRTGVPFPWDMLDSRPLVYASFGTILNGREEAFEAVASACEPLGVQLVMSAGGRDLPARDWPGSAIVVRYAPQLEMLKRCSLFITHAGLNSVLESLSAGIPMVAVPITNDQPAVAARLQRSGAGKVVPIGRLSTERLRTAITAVLGDETHRVSALRLQSEIRAAGGVARAADIIESLV